MIEETSFQFLHEPAGLIGRTLSHPDEVVSDATLAAETKRAILAAWASDRHAVPGAPTLRQLDSGAIVSLASVLDALKALDGPEVSDRLESREAAEFGQGHRPRHDRILLKWRKSPIWRRRKRHDDDDGPPPVPAALVAPGLAAASA